MPQLLTVNHSRPVLWVHCSKLGKAVILASSEKVGRVLSTAIIRAEAGSEKKRNRTRLGICRLIGNITKTASSSTELATSQTRRPKWGLGQIGYPPGAQ